MSFSWRTRTAALPTPATTRFRLDPGHPFHYTNADQFSCARFRGESDSPLLLINHWLSNKLRRVTDSAAVNAYDVLWPRVFECEQERHEIPNFVAVNFYNEGDLLRVVDRLNGVA